MISAALPLPETRACRNKVRNERGSHSLDTGNAIPKFGGMGMGEETKAVFLTQEELYTLHAAFEVLVKGEGTYMMLRLPKVVKTHRGLFEKFCDALGWEAWG